ncbi:macro domain-containing protein [Hymenobacter algoricola]|uniref:Thoeris protein ThsA Macro domain-containing protein n=1 Tax=Hymenobacter algoricola TaxID=486267 RepID=A0ABP7MLX6_9BACT
MRKLKWNYLFTTNYLLIGKYFHLAFGTIWLLIECPSALSSKLEDLIDKGELFILAAALVVSFAFAIFKAFSRTSYTKKFKSAQTSISLKVGDLLAEKEDIVIGSSDFFDFNYNRTIGVSLKSQMISRLFDNDINYINNIVQQSLVGLENIAELDQLKPSGNKLRYPIGTVAVLPQANRRIFVVILTKLKFIGNDKHTQSDHLILNQALIGLWEKIKVEGRKKKFSVPVLGAGLANVNLSLL